MKRVLIVLILAVAGCASYEPHVWSRPEKPESSVKPIAADRLRGVRDTELSYAVTLLANVDYIELTEEDVKRLAKGSIEPSDSEKIYLVRGVSWLNHPPHFRKVYIDESTKALYVVGYTWGGEILIPFQKRVSVASPVIVSIMFTPSVVIPKAVIGGDTVFAHARGALHETGE